MKLELVRASEEHLEALYEHQADPESAAMSGGNRTRDEFFRHWRTNVLGVAGENVFTVFADGALVGSIGAFERDGMRQVGYCFARSSWGRGIASAALSRLLALEPKRPLHARVSEGNAGSMRVLEKNGFQRSERVVDGHWLYTLDFALRDVVESDLPVFFENQRDAQALSLAGVESRDRDAFFAHWRSNVLGRPGVHNQAVVVEGELAGYLGSWSQEGVRWLAYWYGRRFWHRGLASRALAAFLSKVPDRPIYATVAVQNIGSVRVLEKNGFRRGPTSSGHDGGQETFFSLD